MYANDSFVLFVAMLFNQFLFISSDIFTHIRQGNYKITE